MSVYEDCQTAIINILRTMTTEFPNSWQVVPYDYAALDKGLPTTAPHAVVLNPGSFDESALRPEVANQTNDVLMDLFVSWVDAGTSNAKFTVLREAVRAKLRKYPTLGGVAGIQNIVISSASDPAPVDHRTPFGPPEHPTYIVQQIRISITWQGVITGGEYNGS